MNKIINMKNTNSKRNDLIGAILSRDKDKLKKVLQENKPEKWLCIEMDYEKKILKANTKVMTEEEIKKLINEMEKDFCLKLVVMKFNKVNDGSRDENWTFLDSPEFQFDFRNVSLKL